MADSLPTNPTVDHVIADVNANDLHAVVADIPAVVQETKEGYKTTEFYVTILGSLGTLVSGLPEKYQAPLIGALGVAYILSRGLAKNGVPVVKEA